MDAAKDMYKVYSRTSTEDLIKNRHKKLIAQYRLHDQHGYWAKKERARLQYLISQIDAVIQSRVDQSPLF